VDQSALTGESKDADKKPGEVLSSGSVVRRGEGNGVVMLGQQRRCGCRPSRGVTAPAVRRSGAAWFVSRYAAGRLGERGFLRRFAATACDQAHLSRARSDP